MKNLTGSLVHRPLPNLELNESLEVRYVEQTYGKVKEEKSSTKCCACGEPIWVEVRGSVLDSGVTMNHNAFKVIDPRAYVHGTPDYLKLNNVLLECHFDCDNLLKSQLNNNEFVPLDVVG